MAAPIDRLIETLTETRAKLEDELGRIEAYRALRQLEQREASGERLSIVPADHLRRTLEAELAGNHYLSARRKLDEALELLGSWGRGKTEDAGAEPSTETIATPVVADHAPAQAGEPLIPAGVFPAAAAMSGLPADDLSLIRDLPSACVSVISAAGFSRYKALAEIDARGVAMLERLLGQPGIVSRGNWIEQAAILSAGRETRYAARLIAKRAGAEWPPAPAEPELLPPVEIVAAVEVPVDVPVDQMPAPVLQVQADVIAEAADQPPPIESPPAIPFDLTRIRGIDGALSARLSELGATTFSDIAQLTATDVDQLSDLLGVDRDRISREGWIEQAALLSAGRTTRHAELISILPPLAPMPFEIVIAAIDEPSGDLLVAEATAPEIAAAAAEPILIDMPANDTAPQPASPETSPFWAAASGKAAVLRPVRKPADRADKAFDDVAALVARTVATARNVGGMKEKPKRSQPAPARSEAPDRPAAPPANAIGATSEVIIRASSQTPPTAANSARPLSSPTAHVPPAAARRLPIEEPSILPSVDPEASIEIRPLKQAAPVKRTTGTAPAVEIRRSAPAEAKLGPLARTLIQPRSPGTPRTPLAAKRPIAKTSATGNGRQTIVIDELAGRRPSAAVTAAPEPDESLLAPPGLGSLVGRFVKALRGDKAS